MADLFISHSHQDVDSARDLRLQLQSAGYTCWVAPDDVTGPVPWAEQILNAIDDCKVMVVLISTAANNSSHVSKEVGLAVERGKALLPIRVEDVMPAGSLQYLLQLVQWIDAFPGPMRDHLEQVRRFVSATIPAPIPPVADRVERADQAAATDRGGAAPGPIRGPAPVINLDEQNAAAAPALPPARTPTPTADTVSAGTPSPSLWPSAAPQPPAQKPPAPSIRVDARLALVGLTVVAVVVLAAVSGFPWQKPALPFGPTPGPTSARIPTPLPSPGATSVDASIPPVTFPPVTFPPFSPAPGSTFPNPEQAALLAHIPAAIRSSCIPGDAPDFVRASAIVVVDCYPSRAAAPDFIRYASFPTIQAMDAIFNSDAAYAGFRASGTSNGCNSGIGGRGTFGRDGTTVGQLLCYIDPTGTAWLGWTFEPALIWSDAHRGDGNLVALTDWWKSDTNPLP